MTQTDVIDNNGITDVTLQITVTLEISGDTMTFDFKGTVPLCRPGEHRAAHGRHNRLCRDPTRLTNRAAFSAAFGAALRICPTFRSSCTAHAAGANALLECNGPKIDVITTKGLRGSLRQCLCQPAQRGAGRCPSAVVGAIALVDKGGSILTARLTANFLGRMSGRHKLLFWSMSASHSASIREPLRKRSCALPTALWRRRRATRGRDRLPYPRSTYASQYERRSGFARRLTHHV